ncbi:hypothetical protein I7I53_02906 [Histoplasma capsulatum var. duboisii H88]|uniref:Uncharacterized protein n=1 Tax=Ajellomyces capsulatus (strain H88) TaxID=544711 RepID=A0A8A1LLB4_AJEC8|nr:hypothetical protein I7I53_02906 [Histoplasma capsulatum var. duboisii H88]
MQIIGSSGSPKYPTLKPAILAARRSAAILARTTLSKFLLDLPVSGFSACSTVILGECGDHPYSSSESSATSGISTSLPESADKAFSRVLVICKSMSEMHRPRR